MKNSVMMYENYIFESYLLVWTFKNRLFSLDLYRLIWIYWDFFADFEKILWSFSFEYFETFTTARLQETRNLPKPSYRKSSESFVDLGVDFGKSGLMAILISDLHKHGGLLQLFLSARISLDFREGWGRRETLQGYGRRSARSSQQQVRIYLIFAEYCNF